MASTRSNISKMFKQASKVAKRNFKVFKKSTLKLENFDKSKFADMFDVKKWERYIKRKIILRYGASCYRPHQGKQECARRVAKGQAPFEYHHAMEMMRAADNRGVPYVFSDGATTADL